MSMTTAQRYSALEIANDRRLGMAKVRADIRALTRLEGRHLVASMLEAPSEHVDRLKVGVLLHCITRFGDVKVRQTVDLAQVPSQDLHVCDLTGEQRADLSCLLRSGRLPPRPVEEKLAPQPNRRKKRKAKKERSPRNQLVPAAPLQAWLKDALAKGHHLRDIAALSGIGEKRLRRIIDGEVQRIPIDVPDRCLTAIGDHLGEVYPYEESA